MNGRLDACVRMSFQTPQLLAPKLAAKQTKKKTSACAMHMQHGAGMRTLKSLVQLFHCHGGACLPAGQVPSELERSGCLY